MINYDPFWAYLAEHGISTYKLINSYGVSKGLIDRMKHNKAIWLWLRDIIIALRRRTKVARSNINFYVLSCCMIRNSFQKRISETW